MLLLMMLKLYFPYPIGTGPVHKRMRNLHADASVMRRRMHQ